MEHNWRTQIYEDRIGPQDIDDIIFGFKRPTDFDTLEKALLTLPSLKITTLHLKIMYIKDYFEDDIDRFYAFMDKMMYTHLLLMPEIVLSTRKTIEKQVIEFFEWEVFLLYKPFRPVLLYAVLKEE